jgi:2-keto-3-deoxy-L-rhamnonate aldolase RhmA
VIQHMVRISRNSGKRVGGYCDDPDLAAKYRNLGVSYLATSIDSYKFLSAAHFKTR